MTQHLTGTQNISPKPSTLALAVALALLANAPAESGPMAPYQDLQLATLSAPGAASSLHSLTTSTCPDIAVEGNQVREADGSVLVTFKVINHSHADFVSREGMQQLIITTTGSAATVQFSKISRGEEVVWQDVFHAHEFPSTYSARLLFAPDIFSDGNPDNDDCAFHNNHAALEVRP